MMTKVEQGLMVVIPTRNRSGLAMNAIRSVLEQECDVQILVSDNSTEPEEAEVLTRFCTELADERLHYVRPSRPLPMSQHWDWAMQQTLRLSHASHFIYLTDRTIFKPNELPNIIALSTRYPNHVIAYNWDTVFDYMRPIKLEQSVWTGQLIEIPAPRLLALSAQSIFPVCLPKMLNSCAPRSVIEAIRAHFGSVFSSVSPDYNFCYRCLALADSTLYYDKAIIVSYGLDRSNGVSTIRGISTKDNVDFFASLNDFAQDRSLLRAAPVPAFKTVANGIMHEYCQIKHETASDKFPGVNRANYLLRNAQAIDSFEDPQLKREMEALLKKHGFALRAFISRLRARVALRSRLQRMLKSLRGIFVQSRGENTNTEFETVEEALAYATKCLRQRAQSNAHLTSLLNLPAQSVKETL